MAIAGLGYFTRLIGARLVGCGLALSLSLAGHGAASAQSDLCYEYAAKLCGEQMLGECFADDSKWGLLPESCHGDIQTQIEMDREFLEEQNNSSVTSSEELDPELLASYEAFIGIDDLYNSRGERLTAPWQVLRQDRANFHKFGVSQPGDEWDPFFGSIENRAAMEAMLRDGHIDPRAARMLMKGDVMIYVEVFGRDGRGISVFVDVGN